MSHKLKCNKNWNVAKTEITLKLKCPLNRILLELNLTKNNMSPKISVTKTKMSIKLKCH